MLNKLPNGMYVDNDQDIIRTLPDGRTELLAAKGVELNEAQAHHLGLIKSREVGPSETKLGSVTRDLTPTVIETGVPAAESLVTGAPLSDSALTQGDRAIDETLISGRSLVGDHGFVEVDHSESLAIGSNATNPRARGANRRS